MLPLRLRSGPLLASWPQSGKGRTPPRYEDMGFFASRKAEDNDSYQVAIGVGGGANDKSSVVQVIRSRFVSGVRFVLVLAL